ncbi:hypothetical protein ACFLU8_03280 [Chloroflexota bacterium]
MISISHLLCNSVGPGDHLRYERKTNPLWRYNLFAIIHGCSRDICQEISDKVSRETGLTYYVLLYSTKEFRKTRVKYLV